MGVCCSYASLPLLLCLAVSLATCIAEENTPETAKPPSRGWQQVFFNESTRRIRVQLKNISNAEKRMQRKNPAAEHVFGQDKEFPILESRTAACSGDGTFFDTFGHLRGSTEKLTYWSESYRQTRGPPKKKWEESIEKGRRILFVTSQSDFY